MRRPLCTFCSAVSIVLCVAIVLLWALTFRRACGVAWSTPRTYVECYMERGTLRATKLDAPPNQQFLPWPPHAYAEETGHAIRSNGYRHGYSIDVPVALLVAIFLATGVAARRLSPRTDPEARGPLYRALALTFTCSDRRFRAMLLSIVAVAAVWTFLYGRSDSHAGRRLLLGGALPLTALPWAVLVTVEARDRRLRSRRTARGLCAACGYDLRATPDRCPECGEAAVKGGDAT